MPKKNMGKKTARQVLAGILLLLWVSMILSAYFYTNIGNVFYSPYVETRTFPSPNKDIPTLTMNIAYNFTAKGTFSAENPITVSIMIYGVNTTNLLQYYGELGFFGSVFDSSSPQYLKGGEEQNGYVLLKQAPDGTYVGTSTLK
ncbi:MAG: hypothetical protein ABSB10_08855 [Candidatus Bathyarchaeia archaeon]|jgi:hypothetical protein